MFETFLGIRDPGTTALQHLFAMGELARLKRQADVEMRIVSIPGDWSPPVPGVFIKESMIAHVRPCSEKVTAASVIGISAMFHKPTTRLGS